MAETPTDDRVPDEGVPDTEWLHFISTTPCNLQSPGWLDGDSLLPRWGPWIAMLVTAVGFVMVGWLLTPPTPEPEFPAQAGSTLMSPEPPREEGTYDEDWAGQYLQMLAERDGE